MNKLTLVFLLYLQISFFFLVISEAKLSIIEPQPSKSFNISSFQENAGNCSYSVVINTSCSSPIFTRDQISIAFGDANGNQVYASRLDEPIVGAFVRCSSNSFQINGSCVHQICYAYLYKTGTDGWKPESLKINGSNSKAATFYFDKLIPSDVWYGYNLCDEHSISHNHFGRIWIAVIIGLLLALL